MEFWSYDIKIEEKYNWKCQPKKEVSANIIKFEFSSKTFAEIRQIYEGRTQSKFLTRPTAIKPFIAWGDCVYAIE